MASWWIEAQKILQDVNKLNSKISAVLQKEIDLIQELTDTEFKRGKEEEFAKVITLKKSDLAKNYKLRTLINQRKRLIEQKMRLMAQLFKLLEKNSVFLLNQKIEHLALMLEPLNESIRG